MICDDVQIVNWNQELAPQAFSFLRQYMKTSLFLLNNLQTYGAKLTDELYSGNFKCILKVDTVVGVFCLTKSGMILIQTDRVQDYANIVISECAKENRPFKGVLGDWVLIEPLWHALKERFFNLRETLCSRDLLYSLDLKDIVNINDPPGTRLLIAEDFETWAPLMKAYKKELNIGEYNPHEAYKHYMQYVSRQFLWGCFQNDQLVSMCQYNAFVSPFAQIGGVFARPEMRGQGFAKRVMQKMLIDSRSIHQLEKIVLFTGVDQTSARKLYESLGFKRRNSFFGIVLCENVSPQDAVDQVNSIPKLMDQ